LALEREEYAPYSFKIVDFFSRKPKETYRLIFDIGSSTVNAALVRFRGSKKEILKVERSGHIFLPEVKLDSLWRSLKRLMTEVLDAMLKESIIPDEAVILFSSPWYQAQIHAFRLGPKEKFLITEDFLRKSMGGADVEDKYEGGSAALEVEEALVGLEPRVMRARINGYPVQKLLGREVNELSFFSYQPTIYDRAHKEIPSLLEERGISGVKFLTMPFAIYSAMGKIFGSSKDFLAVEVGGEITEMIVVQEGYIQKIASSPMGLNAFVRRVAGVFGLAPQEAYAFLSDYPETKIEPRRKEAMKEIINDAERDWYEDVARMIKRLAEERLLPENIFLFGPGVFLPGLKEVLKKEELGPYTVFGLPFNVDIISSQALSGIISFAPNIRGGPEITPLILASLCC